MNNPQNDPQVTPWGRFWGVMLLLAILALLIIIASTTSVKAQCERSYSVAVSILGGKNYDGATLSMEAGAWGVDSKLGGFIGFTMYNTYVNHISNDPEKSGELYKEPALDIYLRASYKLISDYERGIYHVLTAYGSHEKAFGVSWRLYKQIGDNILVGLEPNYSTRNRSGLNLILTTAF